MRDKTTTTVYLELIRISSYPSGPANAQASVECEGISCRC